MKYFIVGCIIATLVLVLMAAVEGLIVSLLWNWIAPLFWSGAPILTIWQGFGLLLLINLLFSWIIKIKK